MRGIKQLKAKGCSRGMIDILKMQFKSVKADISTVDFSEPFWYTGWEWTNNKYEKFTKDLTDFIFKNRKRLHDTFSMVNYTSKEGAGNYASWWLLQYGFKVVRE